MNFDTLKRDSARSKDFILSETAYIAENMSVRGAGSVAEADAAEHAAKRMSDVGAKVTVQEFDVAPAAAFGWIGVTVVCMLLAYVAYFFVSMVSVALIIVAMVPFIVQGVMMSRAFDGAYIKRKSRNVTALLPCEGEVKHRVFFTAHLDAAHVFRPRMKGRMKFVIAVAALSLVGVAYLFAADIARWAYLGSVGTGLAADEWMIVGLVGIVFVPVWTAALFLIDGKTVSPGAGDDLSGCTVAMALMKALGESGEKLAHTEVGVILTGSEECGLRGSMAWCDEYADTYRDGKTLFVTLDTLRDADKLKVQDRDFNGMKKLDKDVVSLVSAAAAKVGAECGKGGGFGATDAASFAAVGLKAACVTALDPMSDAYHTELDHADSLDGELLEKCFLIALQTVEDLESAD